MWAATQADMHRRGLLSAGRVARLEGLVGWSWDPADDQWEAGFSALLAFTGREGHAGVPAQHVEADHPTGRWASEQRSAFEAGRLQPDRAARLAALPGWSWNPKADEWERVFARLAAFTKREGHVPVPFDDVEGGTPLGRWILVQRRAHTQGDMPPERVARLEALPGWSWDPDPNAWESFFGALEQFAAREGHTLVPRSHTAAGMELGIWVNTQLAACRDGKIPPDRAARLQALAGWNWGVVEA